MEVWRKIKRRWRQRCIRPGLLYAAQCIEELAWSNKNTWALGPELNLTKLAQTFRDMANT